MRGIRLFTAVVMMGCTPALAEPDEDKPLRSRQQSFTEFHEQYVRELRVRAQLAAYELQCVELASSFDAVRACRAAVEKVMREGAVRNEGKDPAALR